LFADSTATSIGALLGTSNTTIMLKVLQESAWEEEPVLHRFSPHCFLPGIVPVTDCRYGNIRRNCSGTYCSGILMMESLAKIKWDEFEEAVSAFSRLL